MDILEFQIKRSILKEEWKNLGNVESALSLPGVEMLQLQQQND